MSKKHCIPHIACLAKALGPLARAQARIISERQRGRRQEFWSPERQRGSRNKFSFLVAQSTFARSSGPQPLSEVGMLYDVPWSFMMLQRRNIFWCEPMGDGAVPCSTLFIPLSSSSRCLMYCPCFQRPYAERYDFRLASASFFHVDSAPALQLLSSLLLLLQPGSNASTIPVFILYSLSNIRDLISLILAHSASIHHSPTCSQAGYLSLFCERHSRYSL
jgi:hypothetical protein